MILFIYSLEFTFNKKRFFFFFEIRWNFKLSGNLKFCFHFSAIAASKITTTYVNLVGVWGFKDIFLVIFLAAIGSVGNWGLGA